jgi:hypothetical protein
MYAGMSPPAALKLVSAPIADLKPKSLILSGSGIIPLGFVAEGDGTVVVKWASPLDPDNPNETLAVKNGRQYTCQIDKIISSDVDLLFFFGDSSAASVHLGGGSSGGGGGGGDATAANQLTQITKAEDTITALGALLSESTGLDIITATQEVRDGIVALGGGGTIGDLFTQLTNLNSAAATDALTQAGIASDVQLSRLAEQAVETNTQDIEDAMINGTQRTQITNGTNNVDVTNTTPSASAQGLVVRPIPTGVQSYQEMVEEISELGTWRGRPAKNVTLIGRRTSFFANVLNDLGQYTLPANGGVSFGELTGTEQLEIVSGSASDTAAGTGARTVKITYIDALNGNVEASTTVTMNGTTPVSLGAVRASAIQYMEVASVGSGGVAAGNITLRITTVNTQWEQILAGYCRSMSGRYTVPTDCVAYLIQASLTARAQFMDLELLVNTLEDGTASGYTTHNAFDIQANGSLAVDLPFHSFPAGTKIKWAAVPGATAGGPRCQVSWTMLLVATP